MHFLDHLEILLGRLKPQRNRRSVPPRTYMCAPPRPHTLNARAYWIAGEPAFAPRLTRLSVIDMLMDDGLEMDDLVHTALTMRCTIW